MSDVAKIKTSRPTEAASVPPEAGNVWFGDPEPPEPMNCAEKIAVAAILASSAACSGYLLITAAQWLYPTFFN